MHVELTAETQAAVDTLVRSGAYSSAEQVLESAVENLLRDEPDNMRIRKLIQEGIDALDKGDFVTREQMLQRLDERRRKRA